MPKKNITHHRHNSYVKKAGSVSTEIIIRQTRASTLHVSTTYLPYVTECHIGDMCVQGYCNAVSQRSVNGFQLDFEYKD